MLFLRLSWRIHQPASAAGNLEDFRETVNVGMIGSKARSIEEDMKLIAREGVILNTVNWQEQEQGGAATIMNEDVHGLAVVVLLACLE